MNLELLNKFGQKMLDYANNAETFLQAEVPDYINQLLQYEFYSSLMSLVMLTVTFIISLLITMYIGMKLKSDFHRQGCLPLSIGWLVILAIVSIINIPCKINKMIKIKYAPKVFIVDYLRKNIK